MPQITIKDANNVNQVVAATANTGQTTASESLPVVLASDHSTIKTQSDGNIKTKFREAFEVYTPNGSKWTQTLGTGDIVKVQGSAASASYLTISKSPYHSGTETAIETVAQFTMPIEMSFGLSTSQNTLGQEFSIEIVDVGTPLADVPDLEISAITQTTTTLTIDTVLDHGLVPGKSIGVRDCSNQLVNYPALVVASIPSPRQITCTAGPGGTIASQTIANPTGTKGFIYFRERFGRAQNGVSQIFENASATNASLYIRSESGDALPSGTIAGSHALTVGSRAPVQAVNAAYTEAFFATTEYRITVQADRTQWFDSAVDSASQPANRLIRTQVCPDPESLYKLRIRATNNKSLTKVDQKVVSVVKSGSTTATFTTEGAHGYTTGDLVVYYGSNSNVAADAPNLTAATAITVTGANTFTAVIGSGTTGNFFGGYVSKVMGGNLMSSLGASAVTAINATLTTLVNGVRQLVLTGNTNWASLTIGDTVEVIGARTSGALLGVDGAWTIANVATTALTLTPATTAFAATLPVDFGLTVCGGAIVKRTDLRIPFIRIFDYSRDRVELLARPSGDTSSVPAVNVNNSVAIASLPTLAAVTTLTTLTTLTGGGSAEDAAAGANPVGVGGVARTVAAPATLINGDAVRHTMTAAAALTTAIGAPVASAEVASAARTTSGNSGTISVPTGGAISGLIVVSAQSGTTPTLDITLEESYDNGTTWTTIWAADRFAGATGTRIIPPLMVLGLRRWVWAVGGTSPSFTFAINTNQLSVNAPITRQIYDRTANVLNGTLNSFTASIPVTGCERVTAKIALTSAGTPATYQIQVSDDNLNWSGVGTATQAAATGVTTLFMPVGISANFARVACTVAGTTQVGNYVAINASS